ncbi:MAG: hypothetical protein GY754_21425 [bacterium]|nr:hypothetical protein [bacterium]
MKKNQNSLFTAAIGLCIVLSAAFMGCEAGLSNSSSNSSEDGSNGFSFSEMYENISELKNEINSLKETINTLNSTQASSTNDLETQINSLNTLVGMASPAGTIVPFAGPEANIPEGWLLCDGDSVSRDTYAALFQAIEASWGSADGSSFNLPNLQGRFLRGLDASGSIDPGARVNLYTGGNSGFTVGSYQDDAFQNHAHQWSFWDTGSFNNGDDANAWDTTNEPRDTLRTKNTSGSVSGRYSSETRPTNAAVNYIIKY